MAKAKNKVIEGDFQYATARIEFGCVKLKYINENCIFEEIPMDITTIKSIEILNQTQSLDTGSGIARGIVGGALLGGAGLVAGASLAKGANINMVTVTFLNGKKSLLEIDKEIFDILFSLKWKLENSSQEEIDKEIEKKYSDELYIPAFCKIIHGDFVDYSFLANRTILIKSNGFKDKVMKFHNAEHIKTFSDNEIEELLKKDELIEHFIELNRALKDKNFVCFEYEYLNGKKFIAVSDVKTFKKIEKLGKKTIKEEKLSKEENRFKLVFIGVIIFVVIACLATI